MIVKVFVEISKRSRVKYEYNYDLKALELDRILHSSVFYPANYGFVINTLAEDGDALDALILTESLIPGTYVDCQVIGYIEMEDEKGVDHKLVCTACNDPNFKDITSINQLSKHLLSEFIEFFRTYKNLEKKKVKVGDVQDYQKAHELVLTCQKRCQN